MSTEKKKHRFNLLSAEEAHNAGLHGSDCDEDHAEDWYCELYDMSTTPPKYIARDGGEPEDQSFFRDWNWVVGLLNEVAEGK